MGGGEKGELGAEAPPPPSIGGAWRQFQTLEFQLFPILSFRSDFFLFGVVDTVRRGAISRRQSKPRRANNISDIFQRELSD